MPPALCKRPDELCGRLGSTALVMVFPPPWANMSSQVCVTKMLLLLQLMHARVWPDSIQLPP
eukprot:3630394-Amphidinium_carterae.1